MGGREKVDRTAAWVMSLAWGAKGIVTKAWFRGEIVPAKCLHHALSQENPEFLHKAIEVEHCFLSRLHYQSLVLFLRAVNEGTSYF